MCEAEGMAMAPWGALGRGAFGTKEDLAKKEAAGEGRKTAPPTEKTKNISASLEKIANAKGTAITSIAQAYVMHKSPYVFPIVGGRKIEHLKSNIEALGVELSDDDIDEIEAAAEFDVGFPMNMLFGYGDAKPYKSGQGFSDMALVKPAGHFDMVQRAKPPKPHKN
jgi:aryl-alcohol dehydrogenase-like predicted oxidoreductase